MKLTKEQFIQLNAFCGYGDFKNAEVIYFGIEEGLGHWDLETNIIARCDYYGKNPSGWFNPSNRLNGYFERCGIEAAEKIKQCSLDRGVASEEKVRNHTIQSLEFMTRLTLFLEEPDKSWFELKADEPELFKRITKYWRESRLFHGDETTKTALFDWKPLPRAKTSDWPYLIEENFFSKKEYEKAYEFKRHNNPFLNEMVQKRLSLLEKILSTESFSTLISFGHQQKKVKLLQDALTRITAEPVQFEEIYLPESKKKISILEIVIQNKKRWIICAPFFDCRCLTRKGLEELAHYILPHFRGGVMV